MEITPAVVENLPRAVAVGVEGARTRFLPDLVIKNTFALYGVQAGRKLIPLASLPWLARVLGPAGWGEMAFVSAMAELIVIVIEFGFTLSATRSIARFRHEPVACGRIVAGVFAAQALLAGIGIAAAVLSSRFIPLFRNHPSLLAAGLVYAVAQGFNPLWYFQGMEQLRLAAALEVGAKTVALGALFLFVHKPEDVWRALIIQALNPIIAIAAGVFLVSQTSFVCRPEWTMVRDAMRDGWHMFTYRSAESLYGVANSFLLGLYTGPVLVGFFSASEKISRATAGLANPIRESLYPRISNLAYKDSMEACRLARIGTYLMVSAGTLCSAGLLLFAHPVILLLMGSSFEPAVTVLRILSPLPLLLAVTFSSGQLWLIPHGRDKVVSHVVICAAALNLGLSFWLGRRWAHTGMAVTVLISEAVVAVSMLWSSFHYLDRGRVQGAAA
jgi:PST family polysaccharide transporter